MALWSKRETDDGSNTSSDDCIFLCSEGNEAINKHYVKQECYFA